jgi:hypothetical protein
MAKRLLACALPFVSLAPVTKEEAAPFVEGQGSAQAEHWVLAPQQLAVADTWLRGRKLDCLAGLGSPPNPSVHVHLVRSDGSKLDLGFYSQRGYASAVETRVGKILCHYPGTETEVAEFRGALGKQK